MAWNVAEKRVQSYADVQWTLPTDEQLPQAIIKGKIKTQCECGRWVQAFRIVDTRDLPAEVTNGQKWACDNCWISWMRHDPHHQRTYLGKPFRILTWLELHGAPAANVTRQLAIDKELRDHLLAKRQAVEVRSQDDGTRREIARINDNMDRQVDVSRL